MNIIERAKSPTPKFFQVLRDLGLVLATLGGAVLAAPIALPAGITTIAGYVAVAGGALSAVSQVTVTDEKQEAKQPEENEGK